jgi:hypothetical protein
MLLELEYLTYICQTSLTINNHLSNLYHQYSDSNSPKEHLNYTYGDNELNNFLLELIEATDRGYNIEEIIRIDSLVKGYYRLEDLIRYMHNIDYLAKKYRKEMLEKSYNHPQLCGYQFEESRLMALAIDNQNHTCSMTLKNVLLYNDKRINRNIPVDCGTVILLFKDTKNVDMNGQINSVTFEANTVYKWYIMETIDKCLEFGMLLLVNNRQFVIQINHSDIEATSFATDCEMF